MSGVSTFPRNNNNNNNVLDARDHLVGEHEHGLRREAPRAEVEEVLEAGPEQVHDQDVAAPLAAEPADARDAHAALNQCFARWSRPIATEGNTTCRIILTTVGRAEVCIRA